ncbi:hybrid sensor histidine kinase/response regulator [Corallincola spongiicola]|uniref:histidine kinase n=1 Tax=Corallincola spongiicola TaxID=2520508 RepID=A0ABY1WN64_9GAMM|nr:ATP-binding protein [Corallincola spongiicola]TAA44988.1 response regulator [Corallincola spongiicola]
MSQPVTSLQSLVKLFSRGKLFLLFSLLALVLAGAASVLIKRDTILPGFAELEEAEVRGRIAVFDALLDESRQHLARLALVSGEHLRNGVYEQLDRDGRTDATLRTNLNQWAVLLQVDFVLLMDPKGQPLFIYAFDQAKQQPLRSEHLLQLVQTLPLAARPVERKQVTSGAVMTDHGAMQLAMAPVESSSQSDGPGMLVVGTLMESRVAKKLSNITRTESAVTFLSPQQVAANTLTRLQEHGQLLRENSANEIEINQLLVGDTGFAPLILRVAVDRDLMRRGEQEAKLVMSLILLASCLLVIAVIAILGFYVVFLRRSQQRIKAVVSRRTEQLKEARDKSERALQEAEKASEAKSAFLANMSHEVRTPINGIIGMAELAAEFPLSADQRSVVDTIMKEAEALRMLINNVLDLSKFEAGCLELAKVDFGLVNCIEELFSAVTLRASNKPIQFHCQIAPNVPLMATGDPMRLRQVLMNLVGNAVKFTETGDIRLEVEVLESLPEQWYLKISVRDTGIGMTAEQQARIFEPFRQADVSITREYGGTGLGTSIALELIDMMDGELAVESELGQGSCFWFTLHLGRAQNRALVGQSQDNLELPTILVAEPNEQVRSTLGLYLQSMGYQTLLAADWSQMVANYRCLFERDASTAVLLVNDSEIPPTTEPEFSARPLVILSDIGQQPKSLSSAGWRTLLRGQLSLPLRWQELRKVLTALEKNDRQVLPEQVSEQQPSQPLRGVQILLAEDYPANQQVATAHLQAAGAEVVLACNGEKAVAAYKRQRPDLVLMDLQMPIMDGFTATEQIRAWDQLQANDVEHPVPIIALSAHSLEGVRERCFDIGMDDFLCKPFRRQGLLSTVQRWLASTKTVFASINTLPDEAESNSAISAPAVIIDMSQLMEEFLGEREIVISTLAQFVELLPTQLTEMQQALLDSEFEQLRAEAHKIKGGAANLTAAALASAAKVLEQRALAGNSDQIGTALADLAGEIKRFCRHVEEIMTGV